MIIYIASQIKESPFNPNIRIKTITPIAINFSNSTNTTVEIVSLNSTFLKKYILNSNITYDINKSFIIGNNTFNNTLWYLLKADPWNVTYKDYMVLTDVARILFIKDKKGHSCRTYKVGGKNLSICDNESVYTLIPYKSNKSLILKVSKLEIPKYEKIPYPPTVDFLCYNYSYDEYVSVYVDEESKTVGNKYIADYYLVIMKDVNHVNKTLCGHLEADLDKAGVYKFEGCYYLGIGPLYFEKIVVVNRNNNTYVDSWTVKSRTLVLPIRHIVYYPFIAWLTGANNTRIVFTVKSDNGIIVNNTSISLEKAIGDRGVYKGFPFEIVVDSRDLIRNNKSAVNYTIVFKINDTINLYGIKINRGYELLNTTIRLELNGSLGEWDNTTTYSFKEIILKDFRRGALPNWVWNNYWRNYSRGDDYLSKLILWGIFNKTYELLDNLSDFSKYFAVTWFFSHLKQNNTIKGYPSEVCLKCILTTECPEWALGTLQKYVYMGLYTNNTQTQEIYYNKTEQYLDYANVNVTYVLTRTGVKDYPHIETDQGIAYLVDFELQHTPCALKEFCYINTPVDAFPYLYRNGSKIVLTKGFRSEPFNFTEDTKVCTIRKYDLGYYNKLIKACVSVS